MRLLLIFVMVILLPLRGWIGESMAMEMSLNQVHALQAHTIDAQKEDRAHRPATSKAAQLINCHGESDPLTGLSANAHTSLDPASAGDCEGCSACQACQAIAVTPTAFLALSLIAPLSHQSTGEPFFASTTPDPSLKPPIS